jgi:hypothetical protein
VAISKSNWYVVAAALLIVIFVVGLVVVSGMRGPASDIRIRNATGRDLQDVVVGRRQYGKIGRGETSGYQSWGPAYRFARVSVIAEGRPMLLQPEDHFGETPLGSGRFTYILSVRRGSARRGMRWI